MNLLLQDTTIKMIAPHGGTLVDCTASLGERKISGSRSLLVIALAFLFRRRQRAEGRRKREKEEGDTSAL
jgi:hypothetical protein